MAEWTEQDVKQIREWNEKDHPRGQPDNAGQFVEKGGGNRKNRGAKAWNNNLTPRGQTDIPPGCTKIGYVQKELGVSYERAQEYVDAIDAYADDNRYSAIRAFQQGQSVENQEEISKISRDIEDYIKKAPRWNGGETFRGVGLSDKELQKFTVNSEHNMKGVSSWSNEITIAEDFANEYKSYGYAVIFHSPTQNKGTAIRHLSKYPGSSGENEVLASKESKYKVLKREPDAHNRIHIYLEEI